MKSGKLKIAVVTLLLLIIFAPCAKAYADELTNSIAADAGGADYGEYVEESEASGNKNISIAGKLLTVIGDSLSGSFGKVFGSFPLLAGILIAASLLSGLKGDNPALAGAYDYISVLVLSAAVFSVAQFAFECTAAALRAINAFSLTYIPLTSTLYVFGGNTAAAAACTSTFSLYLALIETIVNSVLTPLLMCCFALCIVSALPSCVQIGSLLTLIRNSVTTILSFLFTMLSFILYFQTTIAAAADNQAMRTVKFASGVFVPVIGSIVGEAAKSVYSSIGMIKATAGAAGIVALIAIVIPPLISIIAAKLTILLAGMLGRLLGLERECRLLYDVNSLFGVLLAIMIGASMVFIISAALFININAGMTV